MLPQSYTFSHGLCLNHLLHVLLICNQKDQVLRSDISIRLIRFNLVMVIKVLGDVKYLMRSVKRAVDSVGIWTEENWDVKRVNSLYTMVSGRIISK